jgi:hypothetical protein
VSIKTPEELLARRRMTVEIVHECAFYATLALTVLFFWALGGKNLLWNIILAAFGAILDINKKSQLELAAVTLERRERTWRKFVALLLSAFTLLAGLGAALNRTLVVTSAEAAAVDTSDIDREIESQWKTVAIQQEQQNTATRAAWRDDAAAKEEAARKEIKRLQTLKAEKLAGSGSVERVSDMFDLLAKFFHFQNAGAFMVLLLMLAQVAMELSLWVTTPQYWKEMAGTEKPVEKAEKPQKTPETAKLAPEAKPKPAPIVQSRPAKEPVPQKPSVILPKAETPSQKPAIALRELNESVLQVKTPAQAKKTTGGGRFLDLFGGDFN